jgi:hypothetical protein
MRFVRRTTPIMLLALFLALALPGTVTACPNCKEAVAAQPSEMAGMARGYNWSVLLMLAVPFTLLGTGTLMVVHASRRGTLPEL